MTTPQEKDAAEVLAALRQHQHSDAHAEIRVRVQNGRVVLIEETRKWKPGDRD